MRRYPMKSFTVPKPERGRVPWSGALINLHTAAAVARFTLAGEPRWRTVHTARVFPPRPQRRGSRGAVPRKVVHLPARGVLTALHLGKVVLRLWGLRGEEAAQRGVIASETLMHKIVLADQAAAAEEGAAP